MTNKSTGSDDIVDMPLVAVGEKIQIQWPEDGGSSRTINAKVTAVSKSSKKKHGSYYKYELTLYKDNNEVLETRLINLPWERKVKSSKRSREIDTVEPTKLIDDKSAKRSKSESLVPPANNFAADSSTSSAVKVTTSSGITPECLRYIVAPMVGGSELAFRLLCRKYGATIAYTPMMSSERFAVDEEYRKTEFQTTPEDRPLVAHFSANDPKVFLQAAKLVQDQCDAIGRSCQCIFLYFQHSLYYILY